MTHDPLTANWKFLGRIHPRHVLSETEKSYQNTASIETHVNKGEIGRGSPGGIWFVQRWMPPLGQDSNGWNQVLRPNSKLRVRCCGCHRVLQSSSTSHRTKNEEQRSNSVKSTEKLETCNFFRPSPIHKLRVFGAVRWFWCLVPGLPRLLGTSAEQLVDPLVTPACLNLCLQLHLPNLCVKLRSSWRSISSTWQPTTHVHPLAPG